ncbi:MAG: hypothetical protein M3133_11430 [Actinomycetota bacterium]|nr:hypothetical protein [Actinomycetota bacterium]
MPETDRAEKRSPGAAEEGSAGAQQETGVGEEAEAGHRQPAEDVPSEIDIEEIRPEIDKESEEVES